VVMMGVTPIESGLRIGVHSEARPSLGAELGDCEGSEAAWGEEL
jgi:hypothetical protein